MSSICTIVPSARTNAIDSGISVSFIQNAALVSLGNTNSIPQFWSRLARFIRPVSRSLTVLAISTGSAGAFSPGALGKPTTGCAESGKWKHPGRLELVETVELVELPQAMTMATVPTSRGNHSHLITRLRPRGREQPHPGLDARQPALLGDPGKEV